LAVQLISASKTVISAAILGCFEVAGWGAASTRSVIATLIIFVVISLILWQSPTAQRKRS
jgi:hypothetical protein